jgi:hypothetical protein
MSAGIAVSSLILVASGVESVQTQPSIPAVQPIVIRQPRSAPAGVSAWTFRMLEGMGAPDFTLADLRSEREVNLSALRDGRPMVLVFGCFT